MSKTLVGNGTPEDPSIKSLVLEIPPTPEAKHAARSQPSVPPPTGPASKQWMARVAMALFYICLWTSFDLLLQFGKDADGKHTYDPVGVIFCVEVTKLIWSILAHQFSEVQESVFDNWKLAIKFSFPSMLYSFNNILWYYNATNYDAPTLGLLLNLKIVLIGLFTEILFKRRLGAVKWTGLFILLAGCILKEASGRRKALDVSLAPFLFVMLQNSMGSIASVYSELAFKKDKHLSLNIQNIYSYVFSSMFAVFTAIATGRGAAIPGPVGLIRLMTTLPTAPLILLQATGGLATSAVLKFIDAIGKVFCGVIELFTVAVLSSFFLGTELNWDTWVSLVLVASAILIYNFDVAVKKWVTERIINAAAERGYLPLLKVGIALVSITAVYLFSLWWRM